MQFAHDGRFSSHLILLCLEHSGQALLPQDIARKQVPYLQLLHPVLTFGLLVLARRGLCAASAVVEFVTAPGGAPAGGRESDDILPIPPLSNLVESCAGQRLVASMACAAENVNKSEAPIGCVGAAMGRGRDKISRVEIGWLACAGTLVCAGSKMSAGLDRLFARTPATSVKHGARQASPKGFVRLGAKIASNCRQHLCASPEQEQSRRE